MAIGDVLAVAHQEILPTVPDLLARQNSLFSKMKKQYKKGEGGNETIQFPVAVLPNTAEGWISGDVDTLNININQNLVYGQLLYKYFNSNAVVTLRDIAMTNGSDNAKIELAKFKVAYAFNTMVRTISSAMYASGTTSNRQINGFADVFAASGTAYAGLNDTDYSSWLPAYDSVSAVVNYTSIANMLATLGERVGQSPISPETANAYAIDMLISRAKVITTFKNTLQIQQRFQSEEAFKAGTKMLEVDGIPWYSDFYAPGSVDGSTADNYIYFLSTESFEWRVIYGFGMGPKSDMDQTHLIPNQPVQSINSFHVGNLVCNNRRVNGAMKTLIV